jgi:hypothetical protein
MSSNLPAILKSIQSKLVLLSEKQDRLNLENKELLNQLAAVKLRNSELLKGAQEKEESFKTLRLARKMAGDNTDTQGVKRQINELVKEIDKCVALLNR